MLAGFYNRLHSVFAGSYDSYDGISKTVSGSYDNCDGIL